MQCLLWPDILISVRITLSINFSEIASADPDHILVQFANQSSGKSADTTFHFSCAIVLFALEPDESINIIIEFLPKCSIEFNEI